MKKLLIAGIATALLIAVIGISCVSLEDEALLQLKSLNFTILIKASGSEGYWRAHLWETEIPKSKKIDKVFVWEAGKPEGKVEVNRDIQHAFGWFRFTEAEKSFGKYAILFENQKHDWDRHISIEITFE